MVFSDDAGATWQWHDLPLESGGVVRLEFADDSTSLAVAHNGLYISRDAGNTWNRAAAGLPQGSPTDLLVKPDMWLVSLEEGAIYLSRDRGASWSRLEDHGYASRRSNLGQIDALASDSATGLIYAGSSGEGLYVLNLAASAPFASGGGSGK
jgi:photosystem II stability/assembly factor-like uncharacterized protein